MHFYNKHIALLVVLGMAYFTASAQSSDTLKFEEAFDYSAYEYIPDVNEDSVQIRLTSIENEVPLTYNESVLGFINYFLIKDRDYTRRVAALQTKYFPIIEKYLKEYGLPDELKYLAIVESGLNPRAQSRAGAVGLWQFMPLTGRLDYDLHENWYSDNKMDFEKSTIAACRYLSFLHNYFDGNWHLALAAYNSGPGNVRKAIRRSGYKKSFWEIYPYLFRETRSYVPQFIAITYSMNFLEEHGIYLDELEYLPEFDTLMVSSFVHMNELADQADICRETLYQLNSELKHELISSKHELYAIRVPAHKKEIIYNKLEDILLKSAEQEKYWEKYAKNEVGSTYGRQKLAYKVASGDVLGKIAQRYDVRVADIKSWNGLSSNTIRVGQRLNIWVADNFYADVDKKIEVLAQGDNNSSSENGTLEKEYYQVQKGDTLWDISRKFEGLTVEKLKKLNNLTNNEIKPGQKLKITS